MGIFDWLHRSATEEAPSPPEPQPPQPLRWTPELVERFWDGVAQTRLRELNFGRLGGRAFVVAIEHLLSPAATILDFGAGEGEIVSCLLEKGLKVAAYEPSPKRRAAFEGKFGGHERYLGTIGVSHRGNYDVVLMCEVIEHILDEQLDATLKRVSRLAKRGGTLVVTTPNQEELDLSAAYCPVSNVVFHRWQHVRSLTGESLSALLSRYGFSPVVVHYVEYQDAYFLPFDPLWGGPNYQGELPDYLRKIRVNTPATVGNHSGILYIGRKK